MFSKFLPCAALAAACPLLALTPLKLASPPLPVESNQQFVLCAANIGGAALDVTLRFVDVRSGATVATRSLKLAPAGKAPSPDPCLAVEAAQILAAPTVLPAAATSAGQGVSSPLVVGMVMVHQPNFSFNPRLKAVTASLQVRAPGANGMQTVSTFALDTANMPIKRH